MSQATNGHAKVLENGRPRCLALATKGVQTSQEFAALMSALMSDVIEGKIYPVRCNAAVNAGGKMLKVLELEQRYGRKESETDRKVLALTA